MEYPTYNCKNCVEADNIEMVQCDQCDDWFHFICVNVTQDIENHDWICVTCKQILDEIDQLRCNAHPDEADDIDFMNRLIAPIWEISKGKLFVIFERKHNTIEPN